jgi:anti-sigma factor RsiW
MEMAPLPHNCDRARAWISLRLDGELSELEGAMLGAHLERCEACRAYSAEAAGFTVALRGFPLESLERPVTLPVARRTIRRAVQFGAAAALVAASVGLGSVFGALGSGSHAPSLPGSLQDPVVQSGPLPISYYDDPRGLPQRVPADNLPRKGLTPGRSTDL